MNYKTDTEYLFTRSLWSKRSVIPTKNLLSMKHYIKGNPIRWRIKTFYLCGNKNGYISNTEVYTGKCDDANTIGDWGDWILEVTGNLVVCIADQFQNQNYCVYVNRFYTSVTLQFLIQNRGIRLCGRAMTTRKCFLSPWWGSQKIWKMETLR